MKICLIQPPVDDFYATEIRNIPLGLLSIGANLKNHTVSLLDLRKFGRKTLAYPSTFSKLKKYYPAHDKSPFGLYKNYYRFGASQKEFHNLIPSDIEIFGISALFTTYAKNVVELIHFLKRYRPDAKIIIGGHGVAANPGYFIAEGADFEIFGEGEIAFQMLIQAIEKKISDLSPIPNLLWTQQGKIVKNAQKFIQNLDNLNHADYCLPGVPEYRFQGKKHAMLMISRGCPNNCSFCSIHQVMGYQYRIRSVSNVLNELEEKIDQGFRSFDIEDDHFGGNRKWLNDFLDGIIKKFSHLQLSFQAMNGITATNLDEQLLIKMKQAGFSTLNLALVSERKLEQTNLNRPFDTERFTELVYLAKKHGFFITAYLILGLPNNRINQMLDSLLFLAQLPVLIGPSFFYLVPGTTIFKQCELSAEILSDERTYRSSYMPYETENFLRKDLMTLFRITRIINFWKEFAGTKSRYEIKDDRILISPYLPPRENQIQLGLALLEILRETGHIFGATKENRNTYQIFREHINPQIVKDFLQRYQF